MAIIWQIQHLNSDQKKTLKVHLLYNISFILWVKRIYRMGCKQLLPHVR